MEASRDVCQPSSVPFVRYSGKDFSAHTAYMSRKAYLEDGSFVFVANPKGMANLFVYRAGRSPAITRHSNKRIDEHAETFGMTPVVGGNSVFFAADARVFRADAPEFVPIEVARTTYNSDIHAPLSITDDLRWVAARVQQGPISRVCRFAVSEAGQDCLDSPFVGTEQPTADHVQVHPHRPDLLMFAHDGSWVRDRVWHWTVGQSRARALFIQPEFVEMGHESWCRDGQAVCIVQYGSPTRGIPSALIVLDLAGQMVEQYVFDAVYASHAASSPGGRFWVLDSYRPDPNGDLWVYVLDTVEAKLHAVCTVRTGNHPSHPHPSWSADGSKFLYNDVATDGSITIVEVKLADALTHSTVMHLVSAVSGPSGSNTPRARADPVQAALRRAPLDIR